MVCLRFSHHISSSIVVQKKFNDVHGPASMLMHIFGHLRACLFVSAEEKVDGSNLGLSFDENWNMCAQKRSHWITSASEEQYCKLGTWMDKHRASLVQVLGELKCVPLACF